MSINLENGISLKIEGELGRFQSLPIDALIKIAESLQELVNSLAKYDLSNVEAIDLDNFKLELVDFQKGSAIPSFVFTPRIQTVTTSDYGSQRTQIEEKLSSLLEISDKGDYLLLKELYPSNVTRNEIVERLYGFTNSFKDSPVSIYERNTVEGSEEKYRPKKFKSETKRKLIVQISETKPPKEERTAYASVKVTESGGKTRNNIIDLISNEHHSLSYSPSIINVNKNKYILHYPLRCLFEKEEDYYVINNEQLNLIGTGENQLEAEKNFNEEFDFLYNRLNSLAESKLSDSLVRIKYIINSVVKEFINGIG